MNKAERIKRNEYIKSLRLKGMSNSEIAETVGLSEGAVYFIVKDQGLSNIELRNETRTCIYCGKSFEVNIKRHKMQKYCSEQCCDKAYHENRWKKEVDDANGYKVVQRYLQGSEWEYVSGYLHSDGFVKVRHKCGYEMQMSTVTIRHRKVHNCPECARLKAAELIREKDALKEKARIDRKKKRLINRCEKLRVYKVCLVCGKYIPAGKRKYCVKCSEEHTKHRDSMKKRTRYLLRSATEESKTITLGKLYERDKGTCWICGCRCDMSLDSNDNYYPSIDHVLPISKGGKDEWSNIKLAHRVCNSKRSNKTYPEVPQGVFLF